MSTPIRRPLQALFDLFQTGQPERSITPDRVQDTIQSLRPAWGRISANAASGTANVQAVNTWYKISIDTTLGPNARGFSQPENNRLQCACSVPALAISTATLTVSSGANIVWEVAIAKNGVISPESVEKIRIGPGGGSLSATMHADFTQSQGDFTEVWIRNTTNTDNPTITGLYLSTLTFVL